MIRKLQNQPLSIKRKVIIGVVIVASIAVVIPLWALGLEKTLSQPRQKSKDSKTNEEALELLRDNVSRAIDEFNQLKTQMDELNESAKEEVKEATADLPAGPTLPESE